MNMDLVMNHRRWKAVYLTALLTLTPAYASAVSLDAIRIPLGGDAYRFRYQLNNDGSLPGGAALRSFDIAFPLGRITAFANLPGWDESVLTALADDLLVVDAQAGSSLAAGSSLVFHVDFVMRAPGTQPGTQEFAVYDPVTLERLASGTTRVGVPSVPLFSPTERLGLGGLLIAAAGFITRRRWARGANTHERRLPC
jgi:hypothetical protein